MTQIRHIFKIHSSQCQSPGYIFCPFINFTFSFKWDPLCSFTVSAAGCLALFKSPKISLDTFRSVIFQGLGRRLLLSRHLPFCATRAGVCRLSQRLKQCTVQALWSTSPLPPSISQNEPQRPQTLQCSVQAGGGFVPVVFHG